MRKMPIDKTLSKMSIVSGDYEYTKTTLERFNMDILEIAGGQYILTIKNEVTKF